MIKQLVKIAVEIGEHEFELHMPHDAPLGKCFDALQQMISYVVGRINEAHQPPQEPPALEAKEEAKHEE